MIDFPGLLRKVNNDIAELTTLAALEEYRQSLFGKKGALTEQLKLIGSLSVDARSDVGRLVNTTKDEILALIKQRSTVLLEAKLAEQLQAQVIDVTLPGRSRYYGHLHPVTLVMQRLEQICQTLGFVIAYGPEIETDYYNFSALNIPLLHPARGMTDTFYFADGRLLRTHTSPVQIRFLQENRPPLRMISSGRVYRRDSDATHTPMFHQLEGLVLDETVNFGDLKGLLAGLLSEFFAREVKLRFRPTYFPFTEPSAEVDLACVHCDGQGCKICGESGWLEVIGCGMVHPNVCRTMHVDPEVYRGFAFGIGCDRLALLYYKIPDLRLLFENELFFLQQF